MNALVSRSVFATAIMLALITTPWPLTGCAAQADELDLRPIEVKPEPLGQLHPKLKWMKEQKVRAIWVGDDLFDKSV